MDDAMLVNENVSFIMNDTGSRQDMSRLSRGESPVPGGKSALSGDEHSLPLLMLPIWGWWVKEVITPFIAVIGVIGNCLSLVVMKSKSLRRKSYSHYICALAVFDSMVLIRQEVSLIDELMAHFYGWSLFENFNEAGCKIYNFAESICYLMSSWLIVSMSIERMFAIYFPFKKATLCTQRGAISAIITLIVVMSYSQLFRFIMIGHVNNRCGAKDNFLLEYTSLHTYLYQISLVFTLPICLVFVSNMLVLHKIITVQRDASDDNSSSARLTRRIRRRHKSTTMLLIVTFTYIITLFPLILVSSIAMIAIHVRSNHVYRLLIQITPYKDIFETISMVNYGINFFIYVLSGRSFRMEFKKLIGFETTMSASGTRTRQEILGTG